MNESHIPLTWVLLQVGQEVETSAVCIVVLLFGLMKIYLAFVVIFIISNFIGFSSELDKHKFQHSRKPCSLAAI